MKSKLQIIKKKNLVSGLFYAKKKKIWMCIQKKCCGGIINESHHVLTPQWIILILRNGLKYGKWLRWPLWWQLLVDSCPCFQELPPLPLHVTLPTSWGWVTIVLWGHCRWKPLVNPQRLRLPSWLSGNGWRQASQLQFNDLHLCPQ